MNKIQNMDKQQILSKNQQIIFDIIEKAKEPIKAYSILFNVQKKGIKAVSYTHLTLPTTLQV